MMRSAEVKKTLTKHIKNISDSTDQKLYIITKGQGRKPENKIFPNYVKMKNHTKKILKKSFEQDLRTKHQDITDGKINLRDLTSEDAQVGDYRFLEKDREMILSHFIDKIVKNDAGTPIDTMKSMSKSNTFCVEFKNKQKSNIIGFSSISYIKTEDTEGMATKLSNRILEHIEDNIIVFSNHINALYIVDSKILIIFDQSNIKKSFGFDEYHKEVSVNAILKLNELVETSKEFLVKNLTNKSVVNDIVMMYKNNQFEKTIENYKQYDKLFKENKDLDPKFTAVDITENNKIKLDTKDKLYTFVRMSKRNILQDPLDMRDLYIVYGKKSMKK